MLDAVQHLTTAELEAGLAEVRRSPADAGVVELVVARPDVGVRDLLEEGTLDREKGLVGDNWGTRHGEPEVLRQLNVINARLSRLVAIDPERRALAGDQLHVDLDLSIENLPPGTRLALGSAVIEVTELPHTGCSKFVERFGREAMQFVNSSLGRELRLRGMCARVVVAGTVHPGDPIRKVTE
jgi:MOSC domain-containing protein YiiM